MMMNIRNKVKMSIGSYIGYDDYIDALNDAGFCENLRFTKQPVKSYGDGTIMAIKEWHDPVAKKGIACIIERSIDNDTLKEKVEFYSYIGEEDDHIRLNSSNDIDYIDRIQELIESGVIEEVEYEPVGQA